jgi:hypothetical protein
MYDSGCDSFILFLFEYILLGDFFVFVPSEGAEGSMSLLCPLSVLEFLMWKKHYSLSIQHFFMLCYVTEIVHR